MTSEPLLFYLRDHELYYTSFAGSRYNEYAIFIDFHEWRTSSEIPFYQYLRLLNAYKNLIQEINNHSLITIIPTGFFETIRFYNDYFCVWNNYEPYVLNFITKYFPDSHLCSLDQYHFMPSQNIPKFTTLSPCLFLTDSGYQCKILHDYSIQYKEKSPQRF